MSDAEQRLLDAEDLLNVLNVEDGDAYHDAMAEEIEARAALDAAVKWEPGLRIDDEPELAPGPPLPSGEGTAGMTRAAILVVTEGETCAF